MTDREKRKPRNNRNVFEENRRKQVLINRQKRFEQNLSTSLPSIHKTTFNQPIFPKQPEKNQRTSLTSSKRNITYSDFDRELHYSSRDNTTLTKNIRFVRMWFQYLKLALDVEENKLKIRESDEYLTVDREFYEKWNIDEVKTKSFDSWFKTHKHLFTLKPVELIEKKSEIPNDSYIITVPKNSNIVSVRREIDRLLSDKLSNEEETTEYTFADSKVPYITLHIEYNLLVLAYNDVPRERILTLINDRYKHIAEAKTKKPNQKSISDEDLTTSKVDVLSHTNSISRRLNQDAKPRLLKVCSGVFPSQNEKKKELQKKYKKKN